MGHTISFSPSSWVPLHYFQTHSQSCCLLLQEKEERRTGLLKKCSKTIFATTLHVLCTHTFANLAESLWSSTCTAIRTYIHAYASAQLTGVRARRIRRLYILCLLHDHLWCILQMLAKAISVNTWTHWFTHRWHCANLRSACSSRQSTQANWGEEVDWESGVPRVVTGHQPFKCWLQKTMYKKGQLKRDSHLTNQMTVTWQPPDSHMTKLKITWQLLESHTLITWQSHDLRVIQPFIQFHQSHVLCKFLEEDLDVDPAGRAGLILVQPDAGHRSPWDGIRVEQVRKELANIPDFDCVQSMYSGVLQEGQTGVQAACTLHWAEMGHV